jgi:hypothetical protein
MTFNEAITLFKTRVDVDTDCDFDTSNIQSCADAIMNAAYRWSRDTYCLWTYQSSLTLAASTYEYNTTSSASAQRVFHIYGVHVNGNWLEELRPDAFVCTYPNYFKNGESSNPGCYTLSAPSIVRLAYSPSINAINATDNFIKGFRTHITYTLASSGLELEGPEEMHDMIVDRAYLDNTKSYIAAEEAYNRRQIVQTDYDKRASNWKNFNLSQFRKEQRRAGIGQTRMIWGLNYPGGS